jgi:malonyl-CoA/methylmalonyl-CoA synthetase
VYERSDRALGELTFGELRDRADRLSDVLRRRGLAPGDRLAVYLPNRIEFVDLFLACVRAGFVLVPINVLYREREIAHIVADAEPRLIVTTGANASLFPAAEVVDVDELSVEAERAMGNVHRPPIDGDAPVTIVYTSGTTGRSKGAVLTHNNLAANAIALVTCWRITSDDRYLAALPLFHVHGLGNGICSWLVSGCKMRLVERFEAPRSMCDCSSCRLTRRAKLAARCACSSRARRPSRLTCWSRFASDSATRSSSGTA